jgi:hypothetical protein
MEQRQPVVGPLASSVTSIAVLVSAVSVFRALLRALWPAARAPRNESLATSDATASTESEAIVSDISQGNGKGILVAALVGVAIGAGVALLCAPQSGQESREWLARRTRGLKDQVGVALDPNPDFIPNGLIL